MELDPETEIIPALGAKECVFKCQYPLTRSWLGFEDVAVELDPSARSFRATWKVERPSFRKGAVLDGGFRIDSRWILTGATMSR